MKLRDFVTDDEKRYPFSSWGRCLITAGKPKVQLEVGSCIKHCIAHAVGYSKGLRYANAGDWALLVLLLAFFSWAAINSREGRANLNGNLCWCGIYWHWYCRDLFCPPTLPRYLRPSCEYPLTSVTGLSWAISLAWADYSWSICLVHSQQWLSCPVVAFWSTHDQIAWDVV